jgi:hypothetical protein
MSLSPTPRVFCDQTRHLSYDEYVRLWIIVSVVWSGVLAHADPQLVTNKNNVANSPCPNGADGSANGCLEIPPEVTELTFAERRTRLTVVAKTALEPVLTALRTHPTLRVVVVGQFAPDTTSHMAAITERRADVVKWYLVDKSIEADRIDTSASDVVMPENVIKLVFGGMVPGEPVHRLQLEQPVARDPDRFADASQIATLLSDHDVGHDPGPHHQAGENLARQIEAARTQRLSIGADEIGARNGSPPQVDTTHSPGLEIHQPTILSLAAKHSEGDLRRITPGSIPTDTTTPHEIVVRKINTRYKRGLSRCYRQRLIGNADLSDEVDLSFTVDETGNVIDPSTDESDVVLGRCIRSAMMHWRFEIPLDRRAVPTSAKFSVSIELQAR